jgi:arylsulfatase
MIAHWPKGIKRESEKGTRRMADGSLVTDQSGHLVDFMATILELGKARYPDKVDDRKIDPLMGRSLVPVFKGKPREGHQTLYFHFGTDRALRQGDWKIVSAKSGRWELYNMDEDRTEIHDLASMHPQRVKQMAAEWLQIARDKERLKGRHIAPVKSRLQSLNFRKSTLTGSASKN